MTNSYKRQTKDVTFKSRKVVDESKQLYKEDALKTKNEKSFLLDMDKSNLQYAKALDTWDKSEAKKYQEKIDFADQVSPALKQFLSKDLPALATIHHEGQVKKGEQNWDELDEETKLKYKYENSQLLIKQKELVDQKISLADLAEKSGFKDYASFLRNQTKTARTAVFIKLAKESVAGLPGELKNAFADTTTQYTDIEGNTFTAADIDAQGKKGVSNFSTDIEKMIRALPATKGKRNWKSQSIYSGKKITAKSFQWAIVENKLEIKNLISKNPLELRNKSLDRLGELDDQFEQYLNIPNLHRLRGKRT